MAEETPPDKHKTAELPAIQLLEYRLRQLEKNGERAVEQNGEIIGILGEMKTQMALGNQRFDAIEKITVDHEARILGAENDKRGIAGIATGLGAMFAALGSYFTK